MRDTIFFTSYLFDLPFSLLRAPCSVLPATCLLKHRKKYLKHH
ncbi:hypothetical protein [Moorena producens]